MPRARISRNGVQLAKQGFDVDTAPLNQMIISPLFPTMRVIQSGYVTVADYSGYGSAYHRRAVVSFTSTLSRPPIVLVSGVIDSNTSDQSPYYYIVQDGSGGFDLVTHYSIDTYTNRFELYVGKVGSTFLNNIPLTWKYFVFGNTLDP